MVDCNNVIDFIKTFNEFCHNKHTCEYCHFFDYNFDKCRVKDFWVIDITDINYLQKWKEYQDNETVD